MLRFTPDQLVRIVTAGGGIEVRASSLSEDQLTRITAAASSSGATVRIKSAGAMTADQLVRIGTTGGGRVEFVLD